jgi:hypothetical protein
MMNSTRYGNEFNYYFNLSTSILIALIGIPGNIFVFCVYSRKKYRNVAMFRYLMVSVVCGTIQILLNCFFVSASVYIQNDIFCKISTYFQYISCGFVAWVTAVISIDRYFNVKYPRKYLFRNEFSFQLTILFIAFITTLLVYSPVIFHYNLVFNSVLNSTVCGFFDSRSEFIINVSSCILSLFVPFSIMMILTFLATRNLMKLKSNMNINVLKNELKLLEILLGLDLFFFSCYFPYYTCILTFNYLSLGHNSKSQTILNFSIFIKNFYFSSNFCLLFWCNKVFRKHFFSLIKIRK